MTSDDIDQWVRLDHYYLDDGTGLREVTKAEYVAAERAAGFHNVHGSRDEPATSYFSAGGTVGWIQYLGGRR